MRNKKPIVAMDIATTGKGGGPYTSTTRVMNSSLTEKYDFKPILYRTELGNGISIKRIKDLVQQLKDINPDIVHFTGLQLSGFHMAIACKLAGINNTVVTVRGFSGDAIAFNPFKKVILTYILEPITLLLSRRVIGVSEFVVSRQVIKLLTKNRNFVIYNFPPKPKFFLKKNIRKNFGLNDEDVVVVSVARIIKDKGYHILDDAMIRFKNLKNLKFVIVGDGDYLEFMKSKLKDQAENRQVLFLGYRNNIGEILSACDIFVLPTLHETLSVALLEASQAGLALIASNTGGVPEIVKDGYNGLLVEPGNVDSLSEAIKKVYDNADLRAYFSKNAKLRVEEKFSHQSIESKIDKVYQSLLNNKK